MNLRAIDLNLLVVLDALLDEGHVSRAAARLGLTQSAASGALDRCRHLLGDRLLERGPRGMTLTAKARALRKPLAEVLAAVEVVLAVPAPDLATMRQVVRLAMADAPGALIGSALYQALQTSAPGIELIIHPWREADRALEAMSKGEIDLAFAALPSADDDFHRRTVLVERYVVAMRPGHPAAEQFDLSAWLAHPHILVSASGRRSGDLDIALAGRGLTRRIGMVAPSFLMVPPLLASTDLIAMLPSLCLPADAAQSLRVFAPPIAIDGFALHLGWHARRHGDLAVRHVATLVEDLMKARWEQNLALISPGA